MHKFYCLTLDAHFRDFIHSPSTLILKIFRLQKAWSEQRNVVSCDTGLFLVLLFRLPEKDRLCVLHRLLFSVFMENMDIILTTKTDCWIILLWQRHYSQDRDDSDQFFDINALSTTPKEWQKLVSLDGFDWKLSNPIPSNGFSHSNPIQPSLI